MPTVLRRNGFRFVINTDDREPAHVHVYKGGKVVLINLGGGGVKPYVRKVRRTRKSDVKKALIIASEYQRYLLDQWEAIHGGD
jgi:hypothetical protein